MIPWETVGRERAPDGGELILYRRGGEFLIRVDGRELMSSRAHGSEDQLARLACEGMAGASSPRVLIGGLGLGYTLRAALDVLPTAALVDVTEIVPAVVEWNRGLVGTLAGRPLDDPRVNVMVEDVGERMRLAGERYDAIVLDVDNGPAALTRKANHGLYIESGLATAKRSLRVGGVLAVWSADPDVRFERRLVRAGFAVETHSVPARGSGGGPRHTVFLGRA